MIAALLIPGAALCAAGQANSKHNAREEKRNDEALNSATTSSTTSASSQTTATSEKIRYVYEFKQPDFFINHILIEHDTEGRGHIHFTRRNEDEITEPFQLSAAARLRIAAMWNALHFLDSTASYQSSRQYPHLGTIRLGMTEGTRERNAEFNWSDDPNAFGLMNEYRRAADQAILVFEIEVARVNQPLEAPKLMDHLDKMLSRNALSDPQQLIPLLEELRTDERVPLIARNHAARILKKIKK